MEVLHAVRSKKICAVTNSALAGKIVEGGSLELICTGGTYQESSHSFTGGLSELTLSQIYADACIIGADGVAFLDGVTMQSYLNATLAHLMLTRCRGTKIIVADGSKIGRTLHFSAFPLESVDILVTDSSAGSGELLRIRDLGVRVILADTEE